MARAALSPDETIPPRTVVDQEDATVVIPAEWHGRVGAAGTLVLTREAA